jgi:hypothetical protein
MLRRNKRSSVVKKTPSSSSSSTSSDGTVATNALFSQEKKKKRHSARKKSVTRLKSKLSQELSKDAVNDDDDAKTPVVPHRPSLVHMNSLEGMVVGDEEDGASGVAMPAVATTTATTMTANGDVSKPPLPRRASLRKKTKRRKSSVMRLVVRRRSKEGVAAIPVEWIDADDDVEVADIISDGEEEDVFVATRYTNKSAVVGSSA